MIVAMVMAVVMVKWSLCGTGKYRLGMIDGVIPAIGTAYCYTAHCYSAQRYCRRCIGQAALLNRRSRDASTVYSTGVIVICSVLFPVLRRDFVLLFTGGVFALACSCTAIQINAFPGNAQLVLLCLLLSSENSMIIIVISREFRTRVVPVL